MTDLTVETIETPDGYDFVRSDGQRFFLVNTPDGHAVLYAGAQRNKPPAIGLVDFDVSIPDKLAALTSRSRTTRSAMCSRRRATWRRR